MFETRYICYRVPYNKIKSVHSLLFTILTINMVEIEGKELKNKEMLPSRSVRCNISDFIVKPSTGKNRLTRLIIHMHYVHYV